MASLHLIQELNNHGDVTLTSVAHTITLIILFGIYINLSLFVLLQEELATGLWLSGECLLLHSVIVCLDKNEKLLRSVGLEEELKKFSSFSFEVYPAHIMPYSERPAV